MKRLFVYFMFSLAMGAALVPIVAVLLSGHSRDASYYIIPILNFCGWSTALTLLLARYEIKRSMLRLARQFGIEGRFSSFETLSSNFLKEVERKNSAFLTALLERRIGSKEELSHTLERIVAQAYKLLSAESAELALFDKDLGVYHSSFVLGKPFRKSAQAMLSGAMEGEEDELDVSPDVLVQPLAFGGSVLGSIRVGLKRGKLPTIGDREIMHLLALQGGLAIINAQYTEELVRMRRSSEESVKAKTGFLANLSHEIRGPLGIMLNAVEIVLDGLCGPINADQLETLSMVKKNGAHLLELINDVLDYAKVESGKIVPEQVDILVDEVLKDIAAVVRQQADAKSHTLSFKTCDKALIIRCDRRHLRQMLINMLTNAIKYTPDKGKIELWAERSPGNKIRISVRDSGVGIETADRQKVFSPFERIQNPYSINQVGTGLGMSLTRRLAEVNGGSIDFSSEAGRGSHFWLIFPAVEYSSNLGQEEVVESSVSKGNGELILLVEGDVAERNMIVRYLTHIGYRVIAAGNKAEALQALRESNVELALIDNNVIERNEEQFIAELRENAKSSRLPLLLISSRAFVFDIEKYLKAGVDRCLSKPVSLKDLGAICRSLIDGDASSSDAYSKKKAATKAAGKGELVHTRIIRVDDGLH